MNYAKEHYQVPADISRRIRFRGREGVIVSTTHYLQVNFDDQRAGHNDNVHPTDGVEYLKMGKIRKMTRSQQRYQDYLSSEYSGSFAEYIGVKSEHDKRMEIHRRGMLADIYFKYN